MTPEASRHAALGAARDLLIEAGPQAVTLKAVAARIGRTHANLLHHFGSAAGLQKALAVYLTDDVCRTVEEKVALGPHAERQVRNIVDITFDAFSTGGTCALVSWMLMTGHADALEPIVETIHSLINRLTVDAQEQRMLSEDTLILVLMALGDAQMGSQLATALGLDRDAARALATEVVERRIVAFWAAKGHDTVDQECC